MGEGERGRRMELREADGVRAGEKGIKRRRRG